MTRWLSDTNIAFGMQATISNSNRMTRSAPSVTDGKTIDQNGGCYVLQRDSYLQLDAAPKQFCAVQRILIHFQHSGNERFNNFLEIISNFEFFTEFSRKNRTHADSGRPQLSI